MMQGGLFVPEVGQVNSDWYKEWGKAVGVPEIGQLLFENPRLRDRVHSHMIRSGELNLTEQFSDPELAAMNAFSNDRKKLARVCGLVVYGDVLRGSVAKQDLDQLTKMFPIEELRIAAGMRDLHCENGDFSIDMTRFKEIVEHAGEACVAKWKTQLAPQMRYRVDLMDVPGVEDKGDMTSLNQAHAAEIVEAVAAGLGAENLALAA